MVRTTSMNKKPVRTNGNGNIAGLSFDVIVIGGGVVGCAITRNFALSGARVLMLERGADILSGASKANSAILHTGFDAPSDSLELACIKSGYDAYLDLAPRLNLPTLKTGALIVAWNESQLAGLSQIVKKAHNNRINDVRLVDRNALLIREPGLANLALGAVEVPREFVIDPWSTPLAYLTQAVRAGAEYRFNAEVSGGTFDGNYWRLTTNANEFCGSLIINCTGTNGDHIEEICRKPDFEIRPRKGQFLVFDKSASGLINSIILPVPTAITKGVVLTKTIFGNLLLGPTAEEQVDRWEARVDHDKLQELIETGSRMLPGLRAHPVTATYAGLRPATQFADYQITATRNKNWIGVNGIRSTGLTSALGIAMYVEHLCTINFADICQFSLTDLPSWPQMPNLAQDKIRAFQKGDGTEIVCHCENVTRGEIERALSSDIPARNMEGLRRRTRAMMGRCNGFYCSARITQLLACQTSDKDPQVPEA